MIGCCVTTILRCRTVCFYTAIPSAQVYVAALELQIVRPPCEDGAVFGRYIAGQQWFSVNCPFRNRFEVPGETDWLQSIEGEQSQNVSRMIPSSTEAIIPPSRKYFSESMIPAMFSAFLRAVVYENGHGFGWDKDDRDVRAQF